MDASQRSMPMQAALMGSQPLVPVSLSMAGVEASSPSGDAVSLAGSLDFGADDDADDGADADDAEDPAAYLDASGYQPNPDYGGGGLDMDALPSQQGASGCAFQEGRELGKPRRAAQTGERRAPE